MIKNSFNGTCVGQTDKTCAPPQDMPCMQSYCDPVNGTCLLRNKCIPPTSCFDIPCLAGICSVPVPAVNRTCEIVCCSCFLLLLLLLLFVASLFVVCCCCCCHSFVSILCCLGADNKCYTNQQCSGIGTCELTVDSVALAVGAVCQDLGLCFEQRCAMTADVLTCSDLQAKVNCLQPTDPCQVSGCDPLSGECVISPKCVPRSSCETASCSAGGVCSYVPITGATSNPGVTTSPSR